MGTRNQSPSYLEAREKHRRWLLAKRGAGAIARDNLIKEAGGDASKYMDDDRNFDWDAMYDEHREGLVVNTDCAEARKDFDRRKMGKSTLMPKGQKFTRVASIPSWFWWRTISETQNPEYWNDRRNFLKAVLDHPEWACVPLHLIRAELEQLTPSTAKIYGLDGKRIDRRKRINPQFEEIKPIGAIH